MDTYEREKEIHGAPTPVSAKRTTLSMVLAKTKKEEEKYIIIINTGGARRLEQNRKEHGQHRTREVVGVQGGTAATRKRLRQA